MHFIELVRTNMGRYKAVCSCGWSSKVLSKTRAVEEGRKHQKKKNAK